MTGRDLIIYILQNNLEDKNVFEDGKFIGFMSAGEAAVKFNTGVNTIKIWFMFGLIDGITIGDEVFIFENTERPSLEDQVQTYKLYRGLK